jgi:hypothetical protein
VNYTGTKTGITTVGTITDRAILIHFSLTAGVDGNRGDWHYCYISVERAGTTIWFAPIMFDRGTDTSHFAITGNPNMLLEEGDVVYIKFRLNNATNVYASAFAGVTIQPYI